MRTQIWYPSSGQKMEAGGDVRGTSDLSSREVEKRSIMLKALVSGSSRMDMLKP